MLKTDQHSKHLISSKVYKAQYLVESIDNGGWLMHRNRGTRQRHAQSTVSKAIVHAAGVDGRCRQAELSREKRGCALCCASHSGKLSQGKRRKWMGLWRPDDVVFGKDRYWHGDEIDGSKGVDLITGARWRGYVCIR